MWLWLFALLGFYFLFRWYRYRQTLQNITDKYVFITGCDSGFGNQIARQLDERGLRVLAACQTQRGAEQLKEATSQRLQTIILDVTNSESVAAAANWVKQQVGDRGLWGLVNNAGILHPISPCEWLTKDDFTKVLNVNLVGVIDVTLSLISLIRKSKGRIVNVSSIAGRISLCGGGYCVSKFGVEAFSDMLRRDLQSFGVKVSIIEPGFFKTPILNLQILQDKCQEVWSKVPTEIKESYGQGFFEAYCKHFNKLILGSNSNLSQMTDCIEHALTAVYPDTRYSPGWDAKLLYIPLSNLPTELADFVVASTSPVPGKYS
ncbi:17-beta-hydroxysteroid dehydrogenase type 6 [Microcaecilia unicolor]|uniref:17-beta-hydroxysteroid dehydrogenase type 6-like n=1 Tax=Microcaecilia unicolor TaxID=1415580 RepID=A0A6P7XQ57_9AMPH|nr:17-beta-hydroxysteroid dehydrogenase type 6-like [Microcaecilia unicolor]